MKGLILKDIRMTLKYLRLFLIILVFLTVMSVFSGESNMFLTFYPVIITGMIPVTLISYDEKSKWNVYSDTLPLSRAKIVSEKYLLALIASVSVTAISGIAQVVRLLRDGMFDASALFVTLSIMLCAGLVIPSIMLPVIFRFGVEKGRIAYYILIGALCGMLVIIFPELKLTALPEWTPIAVLVLVAVLFGVSWLSAVALYRKRELN